MYEPVTAFVEISDDLIARIAEADERIDELSDQLRDAEHAKQDLLNNAVNSIAAFKVGQEVLSYGKRYRITKVQGEQFGLQGHRAKVWLRYSGANGSRSTVNQWVRNDGYTRLQHCDHPPSNTREG